MASGTHARDLELTQTPDGFDLGRVEGAACHAQALQIALTTALGADPFNVAFGFDGLRAVAEGADPAQMRDRLRLAVARTLAADPRVLRVYDVRVGERGPATRTLTLVADFSTRDAARREVRLSVDSLVAEAGP
ncbi:MAG: hypothetical protein AAGF12_22135 [Myxococcota bacterium]